MKKGRKEKRDRERKGKRERKKGRERKRREGRKQEKVLSFYKRRIRHPILAHPEHGVFQIL